MKILKESSDNSNMTKELERAIFRSIRENVIDNSIDEDGNPLSQEEIITAINNAVNRYLNFINNRW